MKMADTSGIVHSFTADDMSVCSLYEGFDDSVVDKTCQPIDKEVDMDITNLGKLN